MDTRPTTALLLAAGPAAPGVQALLERFEAAAAPEGGAQVLLSGEGLGWAAEGRLAGLAAVADVAVCSRNARGAGWTLETTPPRVRWSSVGTWLAELDGAGRVSLWTALP